jgi:hypothetical protein
MNNTFNHNYRLSLIGAAVMLLTACTSGPQIISAAKMQQDQVEVLAAQTSAADLLADADANNVVGPQTSTKANTQAINQKSIGRWSTRPFVGNRAIAVSGDERLPSVFYTAFNMSFDDIATSGHVPLDAFTQRLTAITRVPIRVKRDVWDTGLGIVNQTPLQPMVAGGVPLPSGGPLPAGGVRSAMFTPGVNLSGPGSVSVDIRPLTKRGGQPKLIDILNFSSDQLGVSFAYSDGAVIIERYVSEALELDFGEGKTKAGLEFGAKGAGSSGASSASSAIKLEQEQQTDMFNSAVTAIREYVSKTPGSSVVSTDFGRVMVTTTKETMGRTRDLVRQINSRLQTRILVQFDVYHFRNTNSDEKGFDWNVVYQSLNKLLGASITSPGSVVTSAAGTVNWNIIPTGTSEASKALGNSSAMLKSFNGLGYSSYVKSYPMLINNRTWGRAMKNDSEVYISELVPGTTTSATGIAVPGVKQTSVTFGDDVAIKAVLLDSNRICLTIAAGFSDLLSLTKADLGTTGFFTQQPKTSQAGIQNQICQDPGETLVISGLSRRVATNNTNTLGEGVAIGLGGSRSIATSTENMMVVIRATQL